jgi:decaprenylphospho-beta-D-ribofuranose 2-oxidase
METAQRILEGWALRSRAVSAVLIPENRTVLEGLQDHLAIKSVIGRGGGASYGDAALNQTGMVVDLKQLNHIIDFNAETGIVTGEAGVALVDLQAAVVPEGWFVATMPGASQATLGGCICCDVHGKNHEKQGTFGENVLGLTLLLASGEEQRCSPEDNAELFWATVGGMGLTGIILDVTLQLIPVETAYMAMEVTKTNNFDETYSAQKKSPDNDYSVTWLDPLSRGKALGRGVVMNARHMKAVDLPQGLGRDPLHWPTRNSYGFPWTPKFGLFRPAFLKAFNSLYYVRQKTTAAVQHAHPFLFPLHRFRDINRLYGANGFYEYQIAVPDEGAYDLIVYILLELQKFKAGSFLTILKRFGAANRAPMSFPISGLTFSIQVLANDPAIPALLDRFDDRTAEAGGRVYLAKDSRLVARTVDLMYPRRKGWAAYLDTIDPNHIFDSDMSQRLGLRG